MGQAWPPQVLALDETRFLWEVPLGSAGRAFAFYTMLSAAFLAALPFAQWYFPEPLRIAVASHFPRPVFVEQQLSLVMPGHVLTAEVAAYSDEVFAYLMLNHARQDPARGASRFLLEYNPEAPEAPYRLILSGQADSAAALADILTVTEASRPGAEPQWKWTTAKRAHALEQQTRVFDAAYNLPVQRRLEELPPADLSANLHRFIRYKSATDPRIRRRLEPVPRSLSPDDAQTLAGDILTVAGFFSLPLDYFLGVGAMENNYMDVRGDLEHSVWKKRPAADDIVLERRRNRVRVLNDSAGVWQITRETLRHAHSLVERDYRDYGSLPAHLRPPEKLKVDEVTPGVLTTYAGALLRDLLDRFDGDVTLAVSAYNGGPARPNLQYGEAVARAAAHARRVLEQAAVLNGEPVVGKTWLLAP